MSQIKNEIQRLQKKLSAMKEGYSELIDKIKNVFYEKEDFWDENSKRKPKNEYQKVIAAYCLAKRECPRSSFDLEAEKRKKYARKKNGDYDFDNYELLDEFTVRDKSFRFRGDEHRRDKPATVVKLKDIKLLDNICKKIWIGQVSNNRTTLGFNDWLEEISIDGLYELIQKEEKYVYTISERKLYIKDMVVILPQSPRGVINGYFID